MKSNLALLPASSRTLTNAIPLDVALVDASGNHITSIGGTGGTSSDFGAAFPSSGTAAGFKDSTGANLAAGNLDASGNLKVNVVAGGAAGSAPATAAQTVVAVDGANHTALASSALRLGAAFHNKSLVGVTLYCGATAGPAAVSAYLLPGERGTLISLFGCLYTGRIDAISDAADATSDNGLYVTAFTA